MHSKLAIETPEMPGNGRHDPSASVINGFDGSGSHGTNLICNINGFGFYEFGPHTPHLKQAELQNQFWFCG